MFLIKCSPEFIKEYLAAEGCVYLLQLIWIYALNQSPQKQSDHEQINNTMKTANNFSSENESNVVWVKSLNLVYKFKRKQPVVQLVEQSSICRKVGNEIVEHRSLKVSFLLPAEI